MGGISPSFQGYYVDLSLVCFLEVELGLFLIRSYFFKVNGSTKKVFQVKFVGYDRNFEIVDIFKFVFFQAFQNGLLDFRGQSQELCLNDSRLVDHPLVKSVVEPRFEGQDLNQKFEYLHEQVEVEVMHVPLAATVPLFQLVQRVKPFVKLALRLLRGHLDAQVKQFT